MVHLLKFKARAEYADGRPRAGLAGRLLIAATAQG